MMKIVSLSFYGLANMMISGSVIINYPKKMKRAHKKYCLIVFYRAVIFFCCSV